MLEKLELYIDNLRQYFKENTSALYYFISGFAVLGMMFFIFSNTFLFFNIKKLQTLNNKMFGDQH